MILALLACGDDPARQGAWLAEDFLLREGTILVFAPLGEPEGPTRSLARSGDAWELRDGEDEDGPVVGTFPVLETDGLVVDGVRMLPATFEQGTTLDGTKVTALGPHEAWYGTFERTVTVEVSEGRFSGTAVFAEPLGPVAFTLDRASWDLVTYE